MREAAMTKAERAADLAAGMTWLGWLSSVAMQTLPIVQWLAGLLAIVSALFAIRYYHKRSR